MIFSGKPLLRMPFLKMEVHFKLVSLVSFELYFVLSVWILLLGFNYSYILMSMVFQFILSTISIQMRFISKVHTMPMFLCNSVGILLLSWNYERIIMLFVCSIKSI
jgi:hypothetical protein